VSDQTGRLGHERWLLIGLLLIAALLAGLVGALFWTFQMLGGASNAPVTHPTVSLAIVALAAIAGVALGRWLAGLAALAVGVALIAGGIWIALYEGGSWVLSALVPALLGVQGLVLCLLAIRLLASAPVRILQDDVIVSGAVALAVVLVWSFL
jgi:hypothetical protein